MNREKFDALVAKLEVRAKASPRGFVRRTAALAMFGFAYMLGVILLAVALTVGFAYSMVLWPNAATFKVGIAGSFAFAAVAWAMVKSLWVTMPAPEGIELRRTNVPKLFALIDELRVELKSPRFHTVLLVGDYNAAVVQVPRLGVFGWHRNYLLVGMLMLRGLSPEEFKAVLAHEFGHLSGSHGQFGNWLYRLRRSWERVFERLVNVQQPGKFALLLTGFVKWFWPRFNAHAFVLSRVNEYEADAIAARLAGAHYAAHALQRSAVHNAFLQENFWPEVYKAASAETEPPKDVYSRAGDALLGAHSPDDVTRWLRAAYLTETNNADTHPCLKDRLHAMGFGQHPNDRREAPRKLPPADPVSAGELYLAAQFEPLHDKLSAQWHTAVAPAWQARHQDATQLRDRLLTVENVPGASTNDSLWKKAQLLIDLEGDKSAIPVLDELLAAEPEHAGACFVRGRVYLKADDNRGVDFVERAAKADLTLVPAACNLLYGYYSRSGQRDQMKEIEKRVDAHHELEQRAQAERNNIRPADSFMPHGLTEEEATALHDVMVTERDIKAAHVVRKRVKIFPSSPCYVIALKIVVPWWKPRSRTANQELVNRVVSRVQLNGYFFVFTDEALMQSLAKNVRKVRNALIYERADVMRSARGIAAV
ncbi:MAG TPA: M48 family metallopeptidase [Gemmatimonadaceae bacterium]|nr:M48 family metallopeptidase [Gemmatimonadaceae bacterium]